MGRRSAVGRSRPSAHGAPRYDRDTGGHKGASESESVGLVPGLAKRPRPSGCIGDVIPALSCACRAHWRLAVSPPVSLLGDIWQRRGARSRQVCRLPSAGGRLQSKRGARTVQYGRAGDVGRGGTSRYRLRDVRLGYLLYLIKRSSTCRERVTEVEEAFISKVRASYVCITYRMRPPSRAGCSPGLYPDIESELRPRCGSAARQELAPGPDWP